MRVALLLCGTAALHAAALRLQGPFTPLNIVPFARIADEIHDAETAAEELKWKIGNSTQEKSSMQWFMATAMKELTNLQKVVMNSSVNGSLGFRYEYCMNETTSHQKGWNRSLTIGEAFKKDDELAPSMVEARMYELYELEQKQKDLTMQLGECTASCSSLISRGRKGGKAKQVLAQRSSEDKVIMIEDPAAAPAPGPAPAGGGGKPDPRTLMRSVAGAIYDTSKSIDHMHMHLKKDASAKAVLETMSSLVMEKLLKAKKAVDQMKQDLEVCEHTPQATRLEKTVTEAMAGNTEVTQELVGAAAGQTKEAQDEVDSLQAKLGACQRRCR